MRILLLLLIFAFSAYASVPIKPVRTAESAGSGAPAWPGGTFPDTSFEGVRYVSSRFLESLFGREGGWVPDRQKFVIPDSAGRKWYFTIDNPYMNIGDEVFNLIYPVRRGPEFLFLPLNPLLRLLNQRLGFTIAAPESSSPPRETSQNGPAKAPARNAVPAGGGNLLDIGAEDRENGTLVTLRTAGPMEWESYWVPPHYILRFEGGRLAPAYPAKAQGRGLVKSILTLQEKDVAQVTLNIPRAIDTVEVAYSAETQGYEITVRRKSARKDEPGSAGGEKREKGASRSLGTIIIDPGHGGKDQGAHVNGVSEAQITLAVSKELKTALAKLGYKALLTREGDEYVSLADRPKFASDKGGDLFLSLHCNSIAGSAKRKKTVSGFIAYILREGESEEDKALARRENQAISEESGKTGKGEISPVEWILLEHQLNIYSKESEGFAEQIVKEFNGFQIGKYSTGASQAGFFVLVGAYMPAVLFEMGYLTHDRDRGTLNSEKGRKQIAERLAKAVHKYRQIQSGASTAKEGKRPIPK